MRLSLDQAWVLTETREGELSLDNSPLRFRFELFEAPTNIISQRTRFRFRVFRYDLFRVLPSSEVMKEDAIQEADHESLVVDSTFDSIDVDAGSRFEAWEYLQEELVKRFERN